MTNGTHSTLPQIGYLTYGDHGEFGYQSSRYALKTTGKISLANLHTVNNSVFSYLGIDFPLLPTDDLQITRGCLHTNIEEHSYY